MKQLKIYFGLLASLFLCQSLALAATYKIDADHTTVSFKIKHLFSKVQGRFDKFEGMIEYDEKNPASWKTEATIQAASINTNVEGRDKHLKGPDFFDVEKFPTITFKSTGVTDASGTNAKLNGVLTIHGVEKPVTLDLEALGVAKDPWGNTVAGFFAKTTINRKDFGLTWSKVAETGQLLVGEEVEIELDVAGILEQ